MLAKFNNFFLSLHCMERLKNKGTRRKSGSTSNPRRFYLEYLGAKGYKKWYIVSKRWDGIRRKWVDKRYERTLGKDVDPDLLAQLRHYLKRASKEGKDIDWAVNEAIGSLKGSKCVGSEPSGDIAVVMKGVKKVMGKYGSRKEGWQSLIGMLVAGRILEPSSKLASASWLRGRHRVWEALGYKGVADLEVDDLYRAIDVLDQKWGFVLKEMKKQIEKLRGGEDKGDRLLMLYDMTSVYVEGEAIEMSRYGYSRDGCSTKKQIIVGLEVDGSGYATDVRVFAGNESDVSVWRQCAVKKVTSGSVQDAIVVGDGGMIPKVEQESLLEAGIKFIGRMRQSEIKKLVREGVIQRELFDQVIGEVEDENGVRYVLIRSLGRMYKELAKMERHLRRMLGSLQELKDRVDKGLLVSKESIDREVGAVLYRRPYRSLIWVKTGEGKLEFGIDEAKRKEKQMWAGIWGLRTNSPKDKYPKIEIVNGYKRLYIVEQAFRYLKTFLLKVRPIYHRLARRISGHVKMCMLAYNVALYLRRQFAPVLKENNKKVREYVTFKEAINRLRKISLIGFSNDKGTITWRWYVPDDELVNQLLASVQLKLPTIQTIAST